MPKLIAWFVDNPIAANLLMFILIASGLLALQDVRKEEFPNVEAPVVTVMVPYLGAAPAEVETGVCTRIEESIDGIENILKVKTTAAEGACSVAIELDMKADKAKALASMNRVLKPGGRLLVLEFSKPVSPLLSKIYDTYSFSALPAMGKIITNDSDSYRYLAESIRKHPDQQTLLEMVEDAGFVDCRYHNMTGGIVAVHRGIKG